MADAETVKLEPCPFCGDSVIKLDYIRDGTQARCMKCGSRGAPTYHGGKGPCETQNRAIAAWNRRTAASRAPQADVRREVIEECAKVADEYARFPGEGFVSKVRVSIAASIANRIRALAPPVDEAGEETP